MNYLKIEKWAYKVVHISPEAMHLSNLGLSYKLVLTFSYEVPRLSLK